MGTLQFGSIGPEVEQLQRALAAAGFDPGGWTAHLVKQQGRP
jgi:peptidoglycan hydrolase-like protein with peptidoglycan-binding domain